MITVALLNMKGGVGKTTLAVNLGYHLYSRAHKRVLIVDLDPQFNASQYLMTYDAYDKHRRNKGTVADIILDATRARMPLMPSKGATVTAEQKKLDRLSTIRMSPDRQSYLLLLPSELDLSKAVKNPQGVEYRLQKALSEWSRYFDYVFIDCAPTDTVLTSSALMAAQYVLVPMKPDRFSILGYGMMKNVFQSFKNDYPDPSKVQDLGVVFTQVSRETNEIEDDCKAQVTRQSAYVFRTQLPQSNSYLRAVHEQCPIFEVRYARVITREVIAKLVSEMEARIQALSTM